MLRIGIDFDNTIACYDNVFLTICHDLKLLTESVKSSKSEIKNLILNFPQGDEIWKKVQGLAYGKYMHKAELFPGLFEFLMISKLKDVELFIVSHKTEYGHYDEEGFLLREEAKKWIKAHLKDESGNLLLKPENIFFESTLENKIGRISKLDLDYFIDDLILVFENTEFPNKTKKILFNSKDNMREDQFHCKSWKKVREYIYGQFLDSEILSLSKLTFPELEIADLSHINGNGNSSVYCLKGLNSNYLLKIYPDLHLDKRDRLTTEFSTCAMLSQLNFPVPKNRTKSSLLNWGVYEWISGHKINEVSVDFVTTAFTFLKRLKNEVHLKSSHFNYASEACLSGYEIENQITKRLEKLYKFSHSELAGFLKNEFNPEFQKRISNAKQELGDHYFSELEQKYWILSPSDFGAHNALISKLEKFYFLDFEYCGWDDPVKLVSDFYWHPGMNLSHELQMKWIELNLEFFSEDILFKSRLKNYLVLFGLRWNLIILNEFNPEVYKKRVIANKDSKDYPTYENICQQQLLKSKLLLEAVKKI